VTNHEHQEEEEVMGDNQYQWKCVSLVGKAGHTLEVYEVQSDSFQADHQLTLLLLV
jgi:hypothetical protein